MKKRLLAVLTALCMLTAIITPVAGTWATEEITPTVEPTAAPTEQPTAAPTEAPVAPVSEETDEEPAVTETPTEEPAVTEEPTETPTEVPTEEPTEAPTEVPTEEPTEAPTEEPTETPTEVPAEEPAEVPTEEPTEAPAETPTEEPTAEPTEAPAELSAKLTTGARSVFANEESIGMTATVTGGVAPYSVALKVGGETVKTETTESGEVSLSYMPTEFGVHTLSVTFTDANGSAASASIEVPVAVREVETEKDWEESVEDVELTGDWRKDLIALAKSQLGYEESSRNFIIDEDGNQQGYTRYGHWYGSSYDEWCAMFISFCLTYAEIPEDLFPQSAACADWKDQLANLGAYEDDEHSYDPKPGDLIFFNWQTDYDVTGELENRPEHIGIVVSVSDETVTTIEGNSAAGVRRREYLLSCNEIVGYGNTAALMKRAGLIFEETEVEGLTEGASALTTADGVKMRAKSGVASDRVATIEAAGTEVLVTGAVAVDDTVWFAVEYNGETGYIRSDLLNILVVEEPMPTVAPEDPEPTEQPAPTEEPAPTETPAEEQLPSVEDSLPSVSDQPLNAEPVNAPYKVGDDAVSFTYAVDGAVAYSWQIAGEEAEIASGDTLTLEATIENMKHAYVCVATDAEGNETVSETVTIVPEELVQWLNSTEVTPEMLDRAMNAKSLESMVIENDALIYVRNGKVYARYDAATGYLIDDATGLVVARVDLESGMIYPVASDAE